jgi:hypothetical protein
MRVTKNIREYIEEQVRIKAEQSIVELKQKADEATKNFIADRDKAEKLCEAILKKLMDKYPLDCRHQPYVSFGCCYERDLPEVKAYYEKLNKLQEKRRLATMEIIAEMELGGTKAELMAKLDALKF